MVDKLQSELQLEIDFFRSLWLDVQSLIRYLSDVMHGCPINMAIDGFWLIIPANLLSPLITIVLVNFV